MRNLRHLQAVFAVLLAILTAAVAHAQTDKPAPSAQELLRKTSQATVRLTGKDARGRDIAPGRGFFVAAEVIATDYYVIKDAIKIYATSADKKRREAHLLGVDESRTLAILSLKEIKAEPLALGLGEELAGGSRVYFPEVSGWSEQKVINHTFVDDRQVIEIAATMTKELRGSPLLNEQGEVVAVAVMKPGSDEAAAFAAPVFYLIPLGEIAVEGGFLGQGGSFSASSESEANEDERPVVSENGDSETGARILRKPSSVLYKSAIRRVVPVYPPKAKKSRIVGLTTVEILINEEGDVLWARGVSGHEFFKEAVVAAVRGWKFPPFTVRGRPVRVIGLLTFNFVS